MFYFSFIYFYNKHILFLTSTWERIRTLNRTENYGYLKISEANTIKEIEIKENVNYKCLRRNKKTPRNQSLLQQSHQRNKHRVIPLVPYSGLFLKQTREECRQMDQTTKELMTIHVEREDIEERKRDDDWLAFKTV